MNNNNDGEVDFDNGCCIVSCTNGQGTISTTGDSTINQWVQTRT
jgi:hypothetical protein